MLIANHALLFLSSSMVVLFGCISPLIPKHKFGSCKFEVTTYIIYTFLFNVSIMLISNISVFHIFLPNILLYLLCNLNIH